MASELDTISPAPSRRPRSADPLVHAPNLVPDSALRVVTVKEGMAISNASRGTIYAAAHRGELRLLKRGRRTLIRIDDLQRWIDGWASYEPRRVGVRKVITKSTLSAS